MNNIKAVGTWSALIFAFAGTMSCGSNGGTTTIAECENGTTRTVNCGPNGENTQAQRCVDYLWVNEGECIDILECETGEVRDLPCGAAEEGILPQRCNTRQHWVPKDEERQVYCANEEDPDACLCVLPTTCTGEHTDVRACGYNDRGTRTRHCEEDAWSEFSACDDPDRCKDDDEQSRLCFGDEGPFGTRIQRRTCVEGAWTSYSACEDPAECHDGDVRVDVCGDDDRGIMYMTCDDGWWAPRDDGACYQIADDILAGRQSAALALDDSSFLYAWGDNRRGALGVRDGDPDWGAEHVLYPIEVAVPSPALEGSGWNVERAFRFDAARTHQCAIDSNAELWCWGRNESGQLAKPADDGTVLHEPAKIALPNQEDVTFVVVGESSVCAVGDHTQLYCWGSNENGRLNAEVEDLEQTHEPQPVITYAGGNRVIGLWMGGARGCVQDALEQVYCWGDNAHGQTNKNTREIVVPEATLNSGVLDSPAHFTPRECSGGGTMIPFESVEGFILTAINSYALSYARASVSSSDNTCNYSTARYHILGVGSAAHGQLGADQTEDAYEAVQLYQVQGVLDEGPVDLRMFAGGSTLCVYAIEPEDEEYRFLCQGDNAHGQIGDADTPFFDSFQDLTDDVDPDREGIQNAIVGDDFLCVHLAESGRIRCRGNNDHGQLGDGTTTSRDASDYVLHRVHAD